MNFLISIPICYFVLMDGKGFVEGIISLLPDEEMKAYRKYIDPHRSDSERDLHRHDLYFNRGQSNRSFHILCLWIAQAFCPGKHSLRGRYGPSSHLLDGYHPCDRVQVLRYGLGRGTDLLPVLAAALIFYLQSCSSGRIWYPPNPPCIRCW